MQIKPTGHTTGDAVNDLPDSLRDIFSCAFESVARVDYQGCYLSVNENYAEVCGYSQDEMVGMAWKDTIHPEDMELVEAKYREVISTGRSEAEVRGLRKNGSVFYKQILMVKGLKSDTSSVHHYCFINDITEKLLDELTVLKSVKSGLESEEQRFHELINEIPGVIFQCNSQDYWSFEYLSPYIEKLTGVPAHSLQGGGGKSYASLIHKDDLARVQKVIDSAISHNQAYTVEYRIRHADGETRVFRERATCKFKGSSRSIQINGIIRDISDNERAEQQLRISETLLDNAKDIVLWMNEAGRIVYANQAACSVLGYDKKELLSLHLFDLDRHVTRENLKVFLNTLSNFPSGELEFESIVSTRDGSDIELWVQSSIVDINNSKYTCAIARDISLEKIEQLSLHIQDSILAFILSCSGEEKIYRKICSESEELLHRNRVCLLLPGEAGTSYACIHSGKIGAKALGILLDYYPSSIKSSASDREHILSHHPDTALPDLFPEQSDSGGEFSTWSLPFKISTGSGTGYLLVCHPDTHVPTAREREFILKLRDLAELVGETRNTSNQYRRLQQVIASADDMVVYVDRNYRYQAVSERYARTRKRKASDFNGRHYAEITGNELFNSVIKPKIDRGLAGEKFELTDWFTDDSGIRDYYHIKIDPVSEDNTISGVIIIMRNITELYSVTESLRETRAHYRTVVESSADIMIISRLSDGKMMAVNNVFIHVTGYSQEEIIGRNADVMYVYPEDRRQLVDMLVNEGYCSEFKTEMKAKDGSAIPVSLSCNLITHQGEECIFTVTRDISERISVHAKLEDKDRSISLLNKVTVAANKSGTVNSALQIILQEICDYAGWQIGHAYILNTTSNYLESTRTWHVNEKSRKSFDDFIALTEEYRFKSGIGLPGRILQSKKPEWIADLDKDKNFPRATSGKHIGLKSGFGFPVLVEDRVVAVLEFFNTDNIEKDEVLLEKLAPVGIQVGRLIERKLAGKALQQSQVNFSKAVNATPDSVIIIRLHDGKILEVNDAVLKSTGYSRKELLEKENGRIFWVDQVACVKHAKRIQKEGQVANYSMLARRKDGSTVPCLMSSTLIDVDGYKCAFSILKDISELSAVQEEIRDKEREVATRIRESENKFRTLYDDLPAMFITLDDRATILSINKYGADHLGMPVTTLIGKSIMDITHPDDTETLDQKIKACLSRPDKVQRCEIRKIHKYGDAIWVRATMRLSGSRDGQRSILITCEDISEARILSEQLEYQANHDALTGLINRVEFEKRLRRVLTSDKDKAAHALCYLDLDQFKIINDTCGHHAGDELLRRIGDVLNTVVRKRDTLARMGGDEFAVLLEHCPLEQAKRVANELLRSIESLRFVWEGKRFVLGVSIGLVPMRAGSGTITDILSAADEACYAAKDSGRNRVHVYHSDDIELSRRRGEMEWVAKINQALEENQFCLHVQPINKLQRHNERSPGNHYEILLRMQSDEGELIYPGAFLPAAERYNLSEKIDQWVVNRTFEWLNKDNRELESLAVCSINLSGHSMGDRNFLDFLMQQFDHTPVSPGKICFEITETAAIANLGAAIQFINALKEIGCLFALDDFGSGVSSFNYLKNLPVDFLKIDGSFIREINKDPIDLAMVRSINEIGQVMGKETIAEFVENDEILNVVLELGIDYAQGYTIGRPAPIELIKPLD